MSSKTLHKISIKNLEHHLDNVADFDKPQILLEQYVTPTNIAALILDAIHKQYNDLEDKFVADLGCGTGKLTIGSLLCGAGLVIGFDLDSSALKLTLKNATRLFCDSDDDENEDGDGDEEKTNLNAKDIYSETERINLIQADVIGTSIEPGKDLFWSNMENKFDTVIMNPPFGTKNNQGIDMIFLRRAINLTNNVVYSLHKSSTRNFIKLKCKEWNVKGKPIFNIKYNLDSTYKFHKKKSVDIEVDLWRIVKNPETTRE